MIVAIAIAIGSVRVAGDGAAAAALLSMVANFLNLSNGGKR